MNLSNYQCTALGLTSHGMMKMGKVELELLSDTEQALVDDQGYPREFTESQIEVGNLIINRYMGESLYWSPPSLIFFNENYFFIIFMKEMGTNQWDENDISK